MALSTLEDLTSVLDDGYIPWICLKRVCGGRKGDFDGWKSHWRAEVWAEAEAAESMDDAIAAGADSQGAWVLYHERRRVPCCERLMNGTCTRKEVSLGQADNHLRQRTVV